MNKKKYSSFWNRFWIVTTILLSIVYITWRIFYTFPYKKGMVSNVFWVILFIAEAIGLLEMAVHFYNMYDHEGAPGIKRQLKKYEYPEVDVLLPTINEDEKLLENTIEAIKNMDYPDKKKVHIYVCDDGNRQEILRLCERTGVNYLARKNNENAKAGNLNYAMSKSHSDYVAVFDADMMPRREFLLKTVPYFVTDRDNLGFIQTPQNFYEPDIFQRNLFLEEDIPNEQDYFYRVIQISKNKSNSVIFGGSNALFSRKALESIGGFVTGVLTEDFATGIEIEKAGFRGLALDEVLADGKTPQDMKSLVKQRKRWAGGCIQSGWKTNFLFTRKLSLKQKLNYFVSISYWYSSIKRLIYFLAPLMFALFGIVVVECSLPQVLMFWLPMYLSTIISMKRFSKGIRSTRWTDIYETTLFPFMLINVILESLGIRQRKFKVTDKERKVKNTSNTYYMIPFILMAAVDIAGIIRLLSLSARQETFTYVVILFWMFVNLYYVLMGLLVAWGRDLNCAKNYTLERSDGVLKEIKLDTNAYMNEGKLIKTYHLKSNNFPDILLRSFLRKIGIS
ncbi:cellulose synthase (UDP-forming) [Acetitomaculum ruminis DSM 5522]|uniref:Cellulose synthase (UDP-forming) n=1 Tax=Acetitomaculum ruminis DSM 5522 TaxID=1120918 RepID=A0A1I0ZVN6_9FIRM|nr:cellulose synthase catalytic subunit [Acetitomaculum ruminis]SFB29834.1 cellulose synthase (UDP-forming) [Acetitomaculum ruminis DSM 5522]